MQMQMTAWNYTGFIIPSYKCARC